jgi:RHS repeat-associated protein
VQKNTGSGFTEYYYGPNGSVQDEYNGSDWTAQYVYAGSGLIAEYKNNTTEFVHTDHLGSTRLVTAVNKSVLDSLDYLPFGKSVAGGTGTTHEFIGKERDAESGLDNFGARFYSATIGRFVTADRVIVVANGFTTLNSGTCIRILETIPWLTLTRTGLKHLNCRILADQLDNDRHELGIR